MAEVLVIIGGIASLMGLLEKIGHFYNHCRRFKNGSVEIQDVFIETRTLRATLDASISQLKCLEDQGCEVKTLGSVIFQTNEKLLEVEQSIKNYGDKDHKGTKVKLSQLVIHSFRRKKVEEQMLALERLKTTMIAAKSHFESVLHQKRYIDIKMSIDSTTIAQKDLKGILVQILDNTDRTNNNFKTLETLCTDILYQKMGVIAQLKDKSTENDQSYGRERCSRASPAPTTTLRTQNKHIVFGEFSGNPFHLLVVCIFLNGTKNQNAVDQARLLLRQYPTPEALAGADCDEISHFFSHLGLFKRAGWLIELAKTWCKDPPQANRLHRKGNGRSEVSHLKGVGVFATDTWRIFCKDNLYKEAGFQLTTPEWKSVLPLNKELKSYLQSLWAKEGFDWDPMDGALRKQGS